MMKLMLLPCEGAMEFPGELVKIQIRIQSEVGSGILPSPQAPALPSVELPQGLCPGK